MSAPMYDIAKMRTLAKRVLKISKQGIHTQGMALAHTEAHLAFDESANPVAVTALLADFESLRAELESVKAERDKLKRVVDVARKIWIEAGRTYSTDLVHGIYALHGAIAALDAEGGGEWVNQE